MAEENVTTPEATDPAAQTQVDQIEEFDPGVEISDHIIGQEIKVPDKPEETEPTTEAAEEPDAGAESQKPDDGDAPAEQPEPEGYDKAINVLKRAKLSKSVIDKMTPEEVMEQAEAIRPIQSDSDRFGVEYDRLRRDYEDLRSKVEQEKPQDAQPDLSVFSPELSKIKDEIGEEPGQALEGILAKQAQQYQFELQALKDSVRNMESARIQRDLSAARESLLNEFPRLKSKETYDRVFDRLRSLHSANDSAQRYGDDLSAMMRDAALLELGSPVTQSDKDKMLGEHKNRLSSQPSSPETNTPSGESFQSLDDLKFAIFMAGENGDKDKVARLKKQLPNNRQP